MISLNFFLAYMRIDVGIMLNGRDIKLRKVR